jgi:hypothetical protein
LKYLVILLLLLIFWAYVLWRLRPYIKMAQRVLGIMKDVRQVSHQDVAEPTRSAAAGQDGQKLVRCASCQTWIPASRAFKLRSQASVYCSHECLERAAAEPPRVRRSSG